MITEHQRKLLYQYGISDQDILEVEMYRYEEQNKQERDLNPPDEEPGYEGVF